MAFSLPILVSGNCAKQSLNMIAVQRGLFIKDTVNDTNLGTRYLRPDSAPAEVK